MEKSPGRFPQVVWSRPDGLILDLVRVTESVQVASSVGWEGFFLGKTWAWDEGWFGGMFWTKKGDV